MKQAVAIVCLCVAAAVLYGIVHDQITARICLEYFTVGHPRAFASDSPTLHALYWGVVATWWVGLPLGILFAFAARFGRRPPLTAGQIAPLIARLLLVMAATAILAGLMGWILASRGLITLIPRLADRMPTAKHTPFLVCGWAHGASYVSGLIGGFATAWLLWRKRTTSSPATQ